MQSLIIDGQPISLKKSESNAERKDDEIMNDPSSRPKKRGREDLTEKYYVQPDLTTITTRVKCMIKPHILNETEKLEVFKYNSSNQLFVLSLSRSESDITIYINDRTIGVINAILQSNVLLAINNVIQIEFCFNEHETKDCKDHILIPVNKVERKYITARDKEEQAAMEDAGVD